MPSYAALHCGFDCLEQAMGASAQLKINLHGRFRIEGPAEEDLTPRGAKDCGLIALLATSQHGERSRTWLQAKLWSDRGPEQAAGSLRQSVAKIRKTLGRHSDVLLSNRQCVRIDLARLTVVSNPALEFLEGIDVRDEAFEDWLTMQRAAALNGASLDTEPLPKGDGGPPSAILLCFDPSPLSTETSNWARQIIGDMIAWSITETFDLPVRQTFQQTSDPGVWKINVGCMAESDRSMVVRLVLSDPESNSILWSAHRAVPVHNEAVSENADVIALVQEMTRAFAARFLDAHSDTMVWSQPDALCYLGVQKLFSMEARNIEAADLLFRKAFELKPRGLYLAWRAHVREIMLVERIKSDLAVLKDESEAFLRRALDMEPSNSMVLALLAINRLHVAEDAEAALQYARRAVRANYGNAMAWWALSAIYLKTENPVKSYGCARMAVDFSFGTPLEFWTQSQLAGAAMAMRKLPEAKAILKNVTFARPDFRPPLRYLLALHATDEEWSAAVATAERLKVLEPGFSLDQLANDKDYPMSLLHQPYGLKRSRILSLL